MSSSEYPEYFTGSSFARDGSDYNPHSKQITISDIIHQLSMRHKYDHIGQVLVIGVVGKLYKSGTPISGDSRRFMLPDLIGRLKSAVSGRWSHLNENEKIARVIGMAEVPEHVTGFFLSPRGRGYEL